MTAHKKTPDGTPAESERRPDIEIELAWPAPEEAKFPSFDEAWKAAVPFLVDCLMDRPMKRLE